MGCSPGSRAICPSRNCDAVSKDIMWHKALNQHWNKTKAFLGESYRRLGGWAGEFDRAAGIGRRLFSLAAPIMQDLGADEAIQHGMKAFGQYDTLRKGVMDADQYAQGHARRIAAADIFS